MSEPNPKVDFFFRKDEKWRSECVHLRAIALSRPLMEELKWGCPCYTLDGQNIVLIHGFKEYVALMFFKGALMDDPANILIRQTENVQAGRQMRFTSGEQIAELEPTIGSYIDSAIEIEKAGLKIDFKKPAEIEYPDELARKLHELPDFKTAFEALTPGRRRAYLLFFTAAKQSKTRETRIEKSLAQILIGKGLNDE